MKKIDKKLISTSFTLMSLSGLSIFIIDDFFKIQTQYGLRSHSLLDEAKFFHNAMSVFFIICFGKIIDSHLLIGLKKKNRKYRKTGILLLTSCSLLMISSPFMFYITNESYLSRLKDLHLILGLAATFFFISHMILVKKR